jgi:hypothetical protein
MVKDLKKVDSENIQEIENLRREIERLTNDNEYEFSTM